METEELPIWVSVRTRLATEKARWKNGSSVLETAPTSRATVYDSLTWPRICGSPTTMESSDEATRNRWRIGFAFAELVKVRLDVFGGDGEILMQEAHQLALAEGSLAFLVGDELHAIAGGDDQAFADAGQVHQGADRVGQAGGGMESRSRTSIGAVV